MAKAGLVALIDMDGTLCDYQGALARDLVALRAPHDPHVGEDDEVPPWLRARENVVRRQPGWWRNLPRLQLGFDLLEELRTLNFEIHVLTKGPLGTPSAWTEKLEWCQQHLPGVPVTITMDKGLVYGKVLIDDYPPYVERWLTWRPRGLVILPAQPWNEGFHHRNAIRYDGHNLADIRAALTRVCEA